MIADTLTLSQRLVCLDTETTGVYRGRDRVIQIGMVIVEPGGEWREDVALVNPEIPIPSEATEVHGITDEMVKDAPRFGELAGELFTVLRDADICGYSVGFDIGMLQEEFKRIGVTWEPKVVIDGFRIYQRFHSRTLTDAVREYLGEDFKEHAHDALADARVTLRVLRSQVIRHELPRTTQELSGFLVASKPNQIDSENKLSWRNGEAVINFGKWSGTPLKDIPKDYLQWIINSQFATDFKDIARRALVGEYPKREQ